MSLVFISEIWSPYSVVSSQEAKDWRSIIKSALFVDAKRNACVGKFVMNAPESKEHLHRDSRWLFSFDCTLPLAAHLVEWRAVEMWWQLSIGCCFNSGSKEGVLILLYSVTDSKSSISGFHCFVDTKRNAFCVWWFINWSTSSYSKLVMNVTRSCSVIPKLKKNSFQKQFNKQFNMNTSCSRCRLRT